MSNKSFVLFAFFALSGATDSGQGLPQCSAEIDPDQWDSCIGVFVSAEGEPEFSEYTGEFRNGTFNGHGVLRGSTTTYTGNFKDGKMDGQGELVLSDGFRAVAQFREGVMNGPARLFDTQGKEVFAGDFVNGEPATTPPVQPLQAEPVENPAPRLAQKAEPSPQMAQMSVKQPAQRGTASSGAAFIPSRKWDCSTGYHPYVSYSSLVTSGNTYTTSWRDGSGSKKGTFSRGNTATSYGGVSVKWDTGTWSTFIGEYVPAGTPHPKTGRTYSYDSVLVGQDASYWPTSCHPKGK